MPLGMDNAGLYIGRCVRNTVSDRVRKAFLSLSSTTPLRPGVLSSFRDAQPGIQPSSAQSTGSRCASDLRTERQGQIDAIVFLTTPRHDLDFAASKKITVYTASMACLWALCAPNRHGIGEIG